MFAIRLIDIAKIKTIYKRTGPAFGLTIGLVYRHQWIFYVLLLIILKHSLLPFCSMAVYHQGRLNYH